MTFLKQFFPQFSYFIGSFHHLLQAFRQGHNFFTNWDEVPYMSCHFDLLATCMNPVDTGHTDYIIIPLPQAKLLTDCLKCAE